MPSMPVIRASMSLLISHPRATPNHPAQYAIPALPSGTWLCYLLRCADDTLYCGITNDLDKRIMTHNAGTASKYTRGRGPVKLEFAESCADKSAALKRELEIKNLSRRQKLALINLALHNARNQ